eukprot:gene5062-5303_t
MQVPPDRAAPAVSPGGQAEKLPSSSSYVRAALSDIGNPCQRLIEECRPRVFRPPAPEVAANGLQVLQQSLKDLDSYWLKGGRQPFMTVLRQWMSAVWGAVGLEVYDQGHEKIWLASVRLSAAAAAAAPAPAAPAEAQTRK